jgi:calcineurin-like phosphoesterase family protein
LAVLFTSDHRFGDRRARTFYRRPFPSVAEMDEAMIERWNGAVQPDDEVWHLGDFAVRQSIERVKLLLRALNGHKHLLHGHSHGRLKPLPRQYDVGVDVCGFRPVRLADILTKGARPAARPMA